ncbi:MAG TPA: hypothetical protein VN654_20105 [Vicinamibacterales bacterium]|nr:hypothetical protein [Vicinamibacterales bacterium]
MRLTFLTAALILTAAWAEAQPVPLTITCNGANGRSVTAVQALNGTIAKAVVDSDERAVVQYDPRNVDGVTPQDHLFVYAHECAHHALGHDPRASFSAAQEQEADCYGIRALMNRVGFTPSDVVILQMDMTGLGTGVARRLPWRARTYDLEGCVPEVAASRQAAARQGETGPDACVVHNDGENAIEKSSRDGRVIEGVYSVRNGCARDVNCTFTIEVGTLLDSDVDVGSWRSFRVQRTMTQDHMLKSAQAGSSAKVDFRFQATVDTVPPRELVDFRVMPACHD